MMASVRPGLKYAQFRSQQIEVYWSLESGLIKYTQETRLDSLTKYCAENIIIQLFNYATKYSNYRPNNLQRLVSTKKCFYFHNLNLIL